MNTAVIYNARTPPSAGTHLSGSGLRVQERINDARPDDVPQNIWNDSSFLASVITVHGVFYTGPESPKWSSGFSIAGLQENLPSTALIAVKRVLLRSSLINTPREIR